VLDFGYVSEAEKREAMAGAQVFIHPSTNESFGIVLLEAWMAGTPALVHAKSEVLRWQCGQADAGLWFQYYPEFEAMMDLLLGNAPLRRQLGENGRRRVKSLYSPEAVAHRFFNALKDESYAPNP
jgi:glycosyltransferase involved in cell wall biosynthesis